jgi:8-oxo-dGTP diphosphatase
MNEAIKIAVNIIVERNGQVLLGKRKGSFGDGKWALPGGHLEYREGLKDAARRELLEETGITARDFVLVNILNLTDSNRHYIYFGFKAIDPAGEPILTEPDKCSGWDWYDPNSLPVDFLETNRGHFKADLLSDK